MTDDLKDFDARLDYVFGPGVRQPPQTVAALMDRALADFDSVMAADIFRPIRQRVGLSQAGAAKILGVDVKTVWRWENDENAPRMAILALLAVIAAAQIPGFAGQIMSVLYGPAAAGPAPGPAAADNSEPS